MSYLMVDPEFKKLTFPLTADEYARLEKSILEEGCRDPLVIWKWNSVILDGHNRYEICTKHNIPCLLYTSPAGADCERSDRDVLPKLRS